MDENQTDTRAAGTPSDLRAETFRTAAEAEAARRAEFRTGMAVIARMAALGMLPSQQRPKAEDERREELRAGLATLAALREGRRVVPPASAALRPRPAHPALTVIDGGRTD